MDVLSLIDKDIWGIDPFFHTANKMLNKTGIHDIKIDLIEHADRFEVKANLPGVSPECIKTTFDLMRNTLTISVNRFEEKNTAGSGEVPPSVHFRERSSFSLSRVIPFKHGSVAGEKITAKHDNGVLELTLPKTNDDRKQVLDIKIS